MSLTSISRIKTWSIKNYWLLVILFVGVFLRLYKLDLQSLWVDEIFSAILSNPELTFSEVLNNFKLTAHPPVYFILLHLFAKVFGASAFALKLLSALVGIVGIIYIYKLGKELMNKNIGLIASALLSINYFHIYYSQEARMYSLYFLFVVISFYYLVKFIKSASIKNAILYGVFAALLINTHYFGLFTLCSQIAILAFFVVQPYKIKRSTFTLRSGIAGLIVIASYLPVFKTVKGHSKTSSLWIPKPHSETLQNIYEAFFGNSEVLIMLSLMLIILFFFTLFQKDNTKNFTLDPEKDKWVFTAFILIICIVTSIFLPLLRSYAKVSIMIDRYFLNILPAVLLLIAMGISTIKNEIIKYGVLACFVLFSWMNMFYVKWHYKGVYKTQFREVSAYIKDNKKDSSPLYSSHKRYYTYYLEKKAIEVNKRKLKTLVQEMQKDSSKLESFWYADAHGLPYSLPKQEEEFIRKHFEVKDSIDLFDAWTKHFELKK